MVFVILCTGFRGVLEPLVNTISRYYEGQADVYAAKIGYSRDLKESLFRIFKTNLSDFNPDWLYSRYFYTHPTFIERHALLSDHAKLE